MTKLTESEIGLRWLVWWSYAGVAYLEAGFSALDEAVEYAAKLTPGLTADGLIPTVVENDGVTA